MLKYFVIIGTFFFSLTLYSQADTILFMNGVILPCEILNMDETEVTYEFKKRKKQKQKSTHKSDIFGIVKDGERTVYYSMNAVVGDDMTITEVEVFMAGQRDARENFNTLPVWIGGLSFGTIAGILTQSTFVLTALPVVTYPLIQYIPVIDIKEDTITDPNHRYNDIYAEGYERVARGRKVIDAIKSSAIGTVIGVLIYRQFLR